ncbi:unnamed protein product [Linum trigynum]|uniref:Uncharacterized protein n=1 Tax=Linum trigynum TaxID=586398 RepID=A0AAV2DFY1_9ROSI
MDIMNEGIEKSLRETGLGSNSTIKKKAKKLEFNNDEAIANVVSELGGLKPVISKAVEALGSLMGDLGDDNNKQAALMIEIGKIEGLTRCEVIDAAIALVDNESKTRLFYAFDNDEDRCYFVKSVLR